MTGTVCNWSRRVWMLNWGSQSCKIAMQTSDSWTLNWSIFLDRTIERSSFILMDFCWLRKIMTNAFDCFRRVNHFRDWLCQWHNPSVSGNKRPKPIDRSSNVSRHWKQFVLINVQCDLGERRVRRVRQLGLVHLIFETHSMVSEIFFYCY